MFVIITPSPSLKLSRIRIFDWMPEREGMIGGQEYLVVWLHEGPSDAFGERPSTRQHVQLVAGPRASSALAMISGGNGLPNQIQIASVKFAGSLYTRACSWYS